MSRFIENVPAPNSSGEFHYLLFNFIDKYAKPNDTILLVSEQKEVEVVFQEYFPGLKTAFLEGNREVYLDLNILHDFVPKYKMVFSQATLEHVCRPSIFIENLSNLTKVGGYIFIHTHNILMQLHKWPYDCVRFFPDFFYQLENYIPIKVVDYEEEGASICMAYERI